MLQHAVTVVLTILAMTAIIPQVPAPLPWLVGGPDEICEPVSPCIMPTFMYDAVQQSIGWYENDGTSVCLAPALGEHPQNPCGPGAEIRQWFAFTRGDVAWGPNAIDHLVLVSQGPIYSGGSVPIGIAEYSGFGHSGKIMLGGVVTFRLPETIALQAPQFPPSTAPTPAMTQAWFLSAFADCVATGDCSTGGLPTPAEFAAMCAADPQCSQDDNHVHDLDPAEITIGGTTVTTGIGR